MRSTHFHQAEWPPRAEPVCVRVWCVPAWAALCVSLGATADGEAIKKCCKVVKKLQVGDLVIGIEPPIVDPATRLTHVKCKTQKGGVEGWVTLKGNAGTLYAESSSVCPSA